MCWGLNGLVHNAVVPECCLLSNPAPNVIISCLVSSINKAADMTTAKSLDNLFRLWSSTFRTFRLFNCRSPAFYLHSASPQLASEPSETLTQNATSAHTHHPYTARGQIISTPAQDPKVTCIHILRRMSLGITQSTFLGPADVVHYFPCIGTPLRFMQAPFCERG